MVHIDSSSFGGDPGGQAVVYRLSQRGIPVVVTGYGADLQETLEKQVA